MGLSFQTPPKREQNTGRVEKNKASRLFDVNTPGKLKFWTQPQQEDDFPFEMGDF